MPEIGATRVRLTPLGQSARHDVVAFRRQKSATLAAELDLVPGLAAQLVRIADAVERAG